MTQHCDVYLLVLQYVDKTSLVIRYGGMVARRAAITIQRAYRRHAMYKKFRSITATAKAQEKRLSRRFTVDVPEWPEGAPPQTCHDTEHLIRNEFDQLQKTLNSTGEWWPREFDIVNHFIHSNVNDD